MATSRVFTLLALLLIRAAALAPRRDRTPAALTWADVRATTCEAADCRGGGCGFRDCASPVSCRGGGCIILNSLAPSCDGGGCKFVDCSNPTCRGGGCDFANTATILLDGFCAGGSCTIDGFAARHKAAGSASY